jgi:putative oxidoreductase
MKIVAIICRVLLGLMFLVFGLNYFLHFIPMPPPPAGTPPAAFMAVMYPSGWLKAQSILQILGGALVLAGVTLPLGLCILCPITVNILLFHLLLAGGQGIAAGLGATVLELVLIYAYRGSFAGILSAKEQPTL